MVVTVRVLNFVEMVINHYKKSGIYGYSPTYIPFIRIDNGTTGNTTIWILINTYHLVNNAYESINAIEFQINLSTRRLINKLLNTLALLVLSSINTNLDLMELVNKFAAVGSVGTMMELGDGTNVN